MKVLQLAIRVALGLGVGTVGKKWVENFWIKTTGERTPSPASVKAAKKNRKKAKKSGDSEAEVDRKTLDDLTPAWQVIVFSIGSGLVTALFSIISDRAAHNVLAKRPRSGRG